MPSPCATMVRETQTQSPSGPEYTKSERLGEWRKFAASLLGDGTAVRVGALDD